MKQQIIVSGLGGQGALTLTRLLAEAAAAMGLPVITSETHGMAQRGGTVISMIKVGPFRGPLIPAGEADRGLFLHPKNLAVHRFYLRDGGAVFVNAAAPRGLPERGRPVPGGSPRPASRGGQPHPPGVRRGPRRVVRRTGPPGGNDRGQDPGALPGGQPAGPSRWAWPRRHDGDLLHNCLTSLEDFINS